MNAPAAFLGGRVLLYGGDCRAVVTGLGAGSIDAVVTDPPYGLGFMGKGWDAADAAAFDVGLWRSVLRALKPGGHLVAFGGTRTYHRMVVAIEDAGFEVRDSILDMIAADEPVRQLLESLSDEQARAFLRCIEESLFGGLLGWIYGSGFPKSHDIAKAIDKRGGASPWQARNADTFPLDGKRSGVRAVAKRARRA